MSLDLISTEDLFIELSKRAQAQQGVFIAMFEGRHEDFPGKSVVVTQALGDVRRCVALAGYQSYQINCWAQDNGVEGQEIVSLIQEVCKPGPNGAQCLRKGGNQP